MEENFHNCFVVENNPGFCTVAKKLTAKLAVCRQDKNSALFLKNKVELDRMLIPFDCLLLNTAEMVLVQSLELLLEIIASQGKDI